MLAIPSPDVLLNLFASAAQMLGMLALALGGGLFAKRRSGVAGAATPPASRRPFFVTLGLLAAVSTAFLLYHMQVADERNQRLRTNLVRKSTEAQLAVGDTSLKTLSFSGQSKHPRGVKTEQLDAWLAEGRQLNLIDVREPEEVEMGQIAGTWARRYPDLQVDTRDLQVAGKQTILLCESGNRSSELCEWFFNEKGITTYFMVGGYEKWVAEYRAMTGQRADGTEIRATPDYPQKQTLLDTPEVVQLFSEQGAQFVDVRYPEDFARDHLPNAINVPLRKLRADEVEAALRALPARPIVAVCYDKRSSFYGLLLGLRLHRMGADFRGRYTVPHEFTVPVAEAAWVAQWKNDREGDTLFGVAKQSAGTALGWIADRVGLLAAILLLVVALRGLMLPFSLLAERDQWHQRRLAPRFQALRERWAADPAVWRRESMRLLRRAGVSPLRNLVGALVQILLFAVALGAVDAAAATRPGSLLWLDLAAADSLGVLPLGFGVVTAAFVRLQQQDKRRWVLPMIFVVAMVALVWQCRAAVQIYLMLSLGLMALQTVLQRRWFAQHEAGALTTTPAPLGLVPLGRAAAWQELGNKATRLGALLEGKLPVPPGFVVPWNVTPTPDQLASACHRAGLLRTAVRSSAQGEDSAESSMAGMFLSLLDVAPADLPAAIARVRDSYGGRPGGVVVQEFRRAQYAGVLFTVDPAHAGRMLVEMVVGGGEGLVSGRATPTAFRFGRASGAPVGDAVPPVPLVRLLELGRAAEQRFLRPQDIEWVYVDGDFQLVQSRDITRLPEHQRDENAVIEAERHRVLDLLAGAPAEAPVLAQTEISELLPQPTTYSLALFESLWAAGGAVDRACRASGFAYDVGVDDPSLVVTAFGRCYVDRRQWQQRSARGLGVAASFRMAAAGKLIEDEWCKALPAQRRRLLQLAAIDPARLADAELLQWCDEVREQFVTSTYAQAETINLAAEFFVGAARRRAQRTGFDAAALLRDDGNVVSRAFAGLAAEGSPEARVGGFLAAFGHRATHDFELAEPRYGEDSAQVYAMLPRDSRRPAAPRGETAVVELPRLLRVAVDRARRFQVLKEEAKHEAMRELAVLRSILHHIGNRFGLGAGVFHLLPSEVARLGDPAFRATAVQVAAERVERRRRLLAIEVPSALSATVVEAIGGPARPVAIASSMVGQCVAGSREIVGRVRVLREPGQLHELEPGEILVARCTDPCWLGAFPVAGGLVTEIGGWLSHAAIQAREHDLPTIVGVADATTTLHTGDLVRLCRNGSIERVVERRIPRRLVDLRTTMVFGDQRIPVHIRDVGVGGAGIEVADAKLLPSGSGHLQLGEEVVEVALAWRNCTRAGVSFAMALTDLPKSGERSVG